MSRPHRWLVALPPLVLLAGVPLANAASAPVAGLPPLLAWLVCGVLLTSAVLALVRVLDLRADAAEAARRADADAGAPQDDGRA